MMVSATSPVYSAAQIAAALGQSKRGVLKALEAVAPGGEILQRGGKTAAWRIDQLPARWHETLAHNARQRGFRDTAHLLSAPGRAWQPEIDGAAVQFSDLAEHCLTDAQRLQRALMPSLARLTAEPPCPAAEAETKGLVEYRGVFGHGVSVQHWRRLINRTMDRAGAAADFSRVELFLAAKLARRSQTAPGYVAAGMHLQSLRRALSAVKRPTEPTANEAVFIWAQAFDELQWLVDEGTTPKVAERAVFDALAGSGVCLARTPDALKKSFQRKLARWQAGGCKPSALTDGRTLPREDAKLALPDEDKHALIARAVERGGRLSQAWREVQSTGELSPEIAGRYIANPANKSYVPSAVRQAIRFDVAQLEDIHHGPRQAKLNGAWIPRDYSDIRPGDWQQGDDCTLPVYYWDHTPDGVRTMRGQFLALVDVKTTYILGYALHSQEQYNARIIRSLITQVHDEYGLPKVGFYFEGNIWKRSRVLTGRKADDVPLEETELGLKEYVQFRHAGLPRAKIIEGVLGILQNEIEPMPGYCGRNEQTEKFERLQKKLREAAAGKIEPASFLMHKDQWADALDRVVAKFNNEPQGGRLNGLSPREAYEQGFDYQQRALRLPAHCRYLLANHRRVELVTKNGVRIVSGGHAYYYRSAATGPLIGQKVLVWHDVEEAPASITITDLKHRRPVEVPRVTPVPSMTATGAQLGAALRQAADHGAYAKTLYRIVKAGFQKNLFRPVHVDLNTVLLGDAIEAGREQLQAADKQRKTVARRVAAAEREIGVRFDKPHRNLERKLSGLEKLRLADELERQEQEGGNAR